MATIVVDVEKLERVLQKSLIYIKDNYRVIGNKHGWHQFLGTNRIGNIATAQALLCFWYCQQDFNERNLALDTLLENQFSTAGDILRGGGWAYVTNVNDIPTTESTCWTLLSLLKINNDLVKVKRSVMRGIQWILANHQHGNGDDAGWGSTKFDPSRIYPTTLALRVLKESDCTNNPQYQEALAWIKNARNLNDGGWGEIKGAPSTHLHTAHTIITLLECGLSLESEIIQKAVDRLLDCFDEKNLWNDFNIGGLVELMDVRAPTDSPRRITYYHFTTPWVLTALIKSGRLQHTAVFKAVNWLLESWRGGYWDHPFLSYMSNKPIWAIHDALLALSTFKSKFTNWQDIEEISLEKNQLVIKGKNKRGYLSSIIKRFIFNKITLGCTVVIFASITLISFRIVTVSKGIWGIILPLIITVIANLLTRK